MKKIIKLLSRFLLIASFSFFLSLNVEALQNVGSFNNLTIAEKGMIYNNSNDTSTSQVGYSLEDISFRNETVKSIFNTINLQTVNGGYGASISQCGLSFVQNGYYSMSFYFIGDSFAQQNYSPSFSKKTYKLGISNNLTGYTSFNYDTFDFGENVYPSSNGLRVEFYTVIFKAPQNGTCLTSVFSTDPTYNHNVNGNPIMYLGYNFEYLGDKPLTEQDIQNALNGQFNSINNKIDDIESSINNNINDLKDKQDEQNETSKGIWATLTDGLGNIGKWFTDLTSSIGNFFKELGSAIAEGFSSLTSSIGDFFSNLFKDIKSLFVGEEVCDVIEQNYFKGYDIDGIYPDSDGWITLEYTSNSSGKFYSSSSIKNLDMSKFLNVFLEVKEASSSSLGRFFPINGTNSQIVGDNSSAIFLKDLTINSSDWIRKDNIFNFKLSVHENDTYFLRSSLLNWNNGTSKITFRMLITDDMTMTLENYEYYDKKQECTSKGGLFGMITNFMSNVGKWFSDLLTGLLEGLKALFIPDGEYFSTYFSSLYDFFVDKLGILMYPIDLFINVLNRFLNLSSSSTGLIHIPEIAIPGFGTLVQEQSFYINENWNEGPLLTLYNIYKAFVSCFVGLCLVNLARKKEKEIVEGSTS